MQTASFLRITPWIATIMAFVVAGCAPPLEVEGSSGGQGGVAQSSSVSTGGQGGSAQSSTGGAGGQGGSAQSSTGGTGGQGGAAMGTEICHGGLDDDQDGAVDCADTDCGNYTCVPPVPAGWQGYVAAHEGLAVQADPQCATEWMSQTSWFSGTLSAPDATCQCSCQPATGGNCIVNLGDDRIAMYNDTSCIQFVAEVTPVAVDSCSLLSTSAITPKSLSYQAQTPATGGSCTPAPSQNKVPAAFDRKVVTCESPLTGAGCAVNEVCAPVPQAPFESSLCIYKHVPDPNVVACPAGYSKAHVFYENILDTRDCASCTCGPAASQTCPMVADIYTSSNCSTTPVVTLPGNGSCGPTGLQNGVATYYKITVLAAGGQCPPSTPMPVGGAQGTNPAVVCCTQ